MGSEFVPLLGKILVMLIALEAVCIIGTRKARVFSLLGRGIKKAAKWLWRLVRWLVKMIWRGICRLGRRPSQQQPRRQNPLNP